MATFNVSWDNNSDFTRNEFVSLIRQNLKSKHGIVGARCADWVFTVLEKSGVFLPRNDTWKFFNYIKDSELRFGQDGKARNPFSVNPSMSEYSNVSDGLIFGYYPNSSYQDVSIDTLNSSSVNNYKISKIKKHENGILRGITHVGIIFEGSIYHLTFNGKSTVLQSNNSAGFKPIAWWPVIDALRESLPQG